MKLRSRLIAFLLAVIMVGSLIPMTVITASAATVTTAYGKIDDTTYPAESYPFAVFLDDEFKGAYPKWADANDSSVDSALEQVRRLTLGMPEDVNVTVLLRRNYTMTSADNFANFAHIGTFTLDLNNFVFTGHKDVPTFQLSPKNTGLTNTTASQTMHATEQRVTVKNGTLGVLCALVNSGINANIDNLEREKNVYFNFTNVTFKLDANCHDSSIYRGNASNNNSKKSVNTFLEFNDCVFDMTAVAKNTTLFALKNAMKHVNSEAPADCSFDTSYSEVVVRGGKFIAGKNLDKITFYTVNYGTDNFAIEKNAKGEYPVLEIPADYTVPAGKWLVLRENGVDTAASFSGAETVNGSTKTVALKKSESVKGQAYMTPYGEIPASYNDPDTYPFIVFADGSFKNATTCLTGSNNNSAYAKARDLAAGSAVSIQILARRDYTLVTDGTKADDSYDNLSHFSKVITVDLAGFTVNLNDNAGYDGSLIHAKAQTRGAAVNAVNMEFIYKNGTVNTNGGVLFVAFIDIRADRAHFYRAQTISATFQNVKINMNEAAVPLVNVLNTCNNDSDLGATFNVTFRDCVIDASKHPGSVALFRLSDTTTKNKAHVRLEGGKLIADLSKVTLSECDKLDSFAFGRNAYGRFTDVQTATAYTEALPTVFDGEMYLAATATADLYELAYKTPYGNIPQKYDPFYYPFATFTDGAFDGAYVVYGKDNQKSALWRARWLTVEGNKSNAQIVLRRDYYMAYVNNANTNHPDNLPYNNNDYNNFAHVSAPLIIDLGDHNVLLGGAPLLHLRAQTKSDSAPPENVNVTVKGGNVITQNSPAVTCYVSVTKAERAKYYTKAMNFNVTFEQTTLTIPANNGKSIVTTKDIANHDNGLGANFNITFSECLFDLSKSPASDANLFIVNESLDRNNAHITVSGGDILCSDTVTLAPALTLNGEKDSLKFGKADGEYTTITVPTANEYAPSSDTLFMGKEGEKLVFSEKSATDTARIYQLGACAHTDDTSCSVDCPICGDNLPHDFENAEWGWSDAQHWLKCNTCPDGNEEKLNVSDHVFDDECDTECDCGYVREVPHNWKTTYEYENGQHWIECVDCGTEKPGSRADCAVGVFGTAANCQQGAKCGTCQNVFTDPDNTVHNYDRRDSNLEDHWMECACGAIDETTREPHNGTATCINAAFCTVCDAHYGDSDPDNHDDSYKYYFSNKDGTHTLYCSCGEEIETVACSVGENGTAADCMNAAICGTCNRAFGDPDDNAHTPATELSSNDDCHWYECTRCHEHLNEAEHTGEYQSENGYHWKMCECGTVFAEGQCGGGEPDCGNPAVCSECGNTYGDISAGGHRPDGIWVSDGTSHWQTCTVDGCGEKVYLEACYGGDATCTEFAVCAICENEYGDYADHVYDGDCDGVCNYCEDERTVTASHKYQNTCDATCDVCREGRTITHTYKNDCDNTCDICFAQRTVGSHTGGTASCSKPAVCSSCGAPYGDLTAHTYGTSYVFNAVKHWNECECGAKANEAFHTFTEVNGTKTCTCGHTVTVMIPVAEEKDNNQIVLSITLGAVVGFVGVGAIVTAFIIKRKKSA